MTTSVATAAPAQRQLSTTLRRVLILAPPLVVAVWMRAGMCSGNSSWTS